MKNENRTTSIRIAAAATVMVSIAILAAILVQSISGTTNAIIISLPQAQAAAPAQGNNTVSPTNSSRLEAAGNATANAAAAAIEGKPQITVTPHSVNAGDKIVVSGSKFSPNTSITITFDGSKNGTAVKSDSSGNFKVTMATPHNAPNGPYDVKATENGSSGKSATASVTIATTPQNQFQPAKK